jgi:hypothetical protein
MTDASLIALDLTTGAQSFGLANTYIMGIEVDGKRVSDSNISPLVTATAGNGFINIDFRSTGVRTLRKIRLIVKQSTSLAFGRFYIAPGDSVFASSNPNGYRMCIVGDSITAGSSSGPSIAGNSFAYQFANLIGCNDVVQNAAGGTGFTVDSSGSQLTYIGRVADVIDLAPDIVYIHGAYNDQPTASATRIAAMVAYMRAVRAGLPNAIIIITGTYGGAIIASMIAVENDQITAVEQFADNRTYFIPVSTDVIPWMSGTGNLTAPNGSGNSDIYVGPSDAAHPSNMGISYWAKRHASGFKKLLSSMN